MVAVPRVHRDSRPEILRTRIHRGDRREESRHPLGTEGHRYPDDILQEQGCRHRIVRRRIPPGNGGHRHIHPDRDHMGRIHGFGPVLEEEDGEGTGDGGSDLRVFLILVIVDEFQNIAGLTSQHPAYAVQSAESDG